MNTETLQSILQKVEEMNLSEGAYLEFANMMKKQYEKQPTVLRTNYINRTIVFHGVKQNATIRLISNTLFNGSKPIIDYEVNGVNHKSTEDDIVNKMVRLFHTIRVTGFTLSAEGIVEKITYMEFYRHVMDMEKAEYEARGIEVDEDDEINYNYTLKYVLAQLFAE